MIELADMDVEEQTFRFLFRHFLSLGFIVEDFDENGYTKGARGFCISGSLFEYKGFYAILTAGHVIQDINKMVEKGKFKIHGCYLLDCFGNEGVFREPFAFDYDGAPKQLIYDSEAGLDFGLIGLPDPASPLFTGSRESSRVALATDGRATGGRIKLRAVIVRRGDRSPVRIDSPGISAGPAD